MDFANWDATLGRERTRKVKTPSAVPQGTPKHEIAAVAKISPFHLRLPIACAVNNFRTVNEAIIREMAIPIDMNTRPMTFGGASEGFAPSKAPKSMRAPMAT